ncbi:endolytic transglycosylase MltG [Lysobacter pythonis]|uniref:Endolytic murein transglycosylase n=1 Tax=Solilutibacter pythonis TaxID=2483112 RepID=A0A3M2HV93_9GAMM|nr:endolytic transglycosylase MltG [Lysobacter pythonis]RMH90842.1 endolytic transglycosylase MltG [Lysobacter pythonis]
MKKRGCRSAITTFFLLVVCVALALGALWQRERAFAESPVPGLKPGASVIVARGDSFKVVLGKLRAAGVGAGHDLEWQALAKYTGAAGKVQVGEYALKPGITPRRILADMRDGKVISYRFTLVEGWNIRDLRRALRNAPNLKQETADLDDAGMMKAIGKAGEHPEGRFLPETYQYNRGDSDATVLKRAYAAMEKMLDDTWKGRDPELPFKTAYELLTMASIVEKETGIASERAQIAGVFDRRLKLGMRLETDPTIIYGLGEKWDGKFTWAHLRTDGPYNTRTRAGLPPTPIAMPGRDSLKATAHPAPGDALFFVAVGDGSGRSRFARTYTEHQRNVRAYLANRRADAARADEPMRGTVTMSEDGAPLSVSDAPASEVPAR